MIILFKRPETIVKILFPRYMSSNDSFIFLTDALLLISIIFRVYNFFVCDHPVQQTSLMTLCRHEVARFFKF